MGPLKMGTPYGDPTSQFLHWRVLLRLGALPAFVLFLLSRMAAGDGHHEIASGNEHGVALNYHIWLVVWNIFYFSIYWE